MTLPKQAIPVVRDLTRSQSAKPAETVAAQACMNPFVCQSPLKQCGPCVGGQQRCFLGRNWCDCDC